MSRVVVSEHPLRRRASRRSRAGSVRRSSSRHRRQGSNRSSPGNRKPNGGSIKAPSSQDAAEKGTAAADSVFYSPEAGDREANRANKLHPLYIKGAVIRLIESGIGLTFRYTHASLYSVYVHSVVSPHIPNHCLLAMMLYSLTGLANKIVALFSTNILKFWKHFTKSDDARCDGSYVIESGQLKGSWVSWLKVKLRLRELLFQSDE